MKKQEERRRRRRAKGSLRSHRLFLREGREETVSGAHRRTWIGQQKKTARRSWDGKRERGRRKEKPQTSSGEKRDFRRRPSTKNLFSHSRRPFSLVSFLSPSQKNTPQVLERREEIDWSRHIAFSAFGIIYLVRRRTLRELTRERLKEDERKK